MLRWNIFGVVLTVTLYVVHYTHAEAESWVPKLFHADLGLMRASIVSVTSQTLVYGLILRYYNSNYQNLFLGLSGDFFCYVNQKGTSTGNYIVITVYCNFSRWP